MTIGYVGLGKMGKNMVLRLLGKKWDIVAYDRSAEPRGEVAKAGAKAVTSLQEMVNVMPAPRCIWLMVTHNAVDIVLEQLLPLLAKGDTVIDGGNSPFKDSVRRAKDLESKGIHFIDAGVSGGPGGSRTGACVMVGGEKEIFARYENLFRDIAVAGGYRHVGAAGAGHFVKMVHNGIEYGMMQALAEGFTMLKQSPYNLDLSAVTDLYNHQSVITSRLVGWLQDAFKVYGRELDGVSGSISHTGEGKWTVDTAKEMGIPAPIIEGAFNFRIASGANPSYTGKIVSALRNQFGQHEVGEKK